MAKKIIKKIFQLGGVDVVRYDKARVQYSTLFNKYKDFTMIPEDLFVANLDLCRQYMDVPGDIVECGVWRGGMCGAMAELAGNNKRLHLFDSFEGLPPAKDIDGVDAIAWQKDTTSPTYYENCTAEESFAIQAMKIANQEDYRIYRGWFNKTLSQFDGKRISILRLDGDWYDSVMDCLVELFPKVVPGGLILIDDYLTWEGCTKAVHDYLSQTKSPSAIRQWNNVPYIIKKG